MLPDIRIAWRGLRHNPGSSIAVVLSLAAGMGANTAIFSVAHGLLGRTLAVPEPDRLVAIHEIGRAHV